MRGKTELVAQSRTFMDIALDEARQAAARGEVPVGAVLVCHGDIVARDGNRTVEHNDPSAHAETLVIRQACNLAQSQRLPDHDLYVTLEPCALCAAIISFARIRRLYFGASDAKSGGVLHGGQFFQQATCHHAPEVYPGIAEAEAGDVLRNFFAGKRGR
ncbi:MAG: nucleoside deaminase [Pseudomonadota bacterium]